MNTASFQVISLYFIAISSALVNGKIDSDLLLRTNNLHNRNEIVGKVGSLDIAVYQQVDSSLIAISETQFRNYKMDYQPPCHVDSSGSVVGTNLILVSHCKVVCEAMLFDVLSGDSLALPSTYDQGIKDLLFSPSCKQLIVYSSYDGTDYAKYYAQRAEIIGFDINVHGGLQSMNQKFVYYSNEWSIEDLVWIDNSTVALKLYSDSKWLHEVDLQYYYFQAILTK